MASGTLNTRQVQITQIKLGVMSAAAGATQTTATFSYTNPVGYKRIIMDPHIIYTESSNYATVKTLLYTIDEENLEIRICLNRESGGAISPSIYAIAIDVPV